MFEKNSCCSYCGSRYPEGEPWPRVCRECGSTNYLNPIPVVVLLVPVGGGLVVARRNIEPQKGTLVLPGGYLDLGESWRNGLDNTLVISGLAPKQPRSCLKPFSSAETQEIALIEEPIELGFPLHNLLVRRYFAEKSKIAAKL